MLRQKHHDIIIIGAGISGLYAAARLARHGADFALIEASDRVGGRIFSVDTDLGNHAELGAEEIDGELSSAYAFFTGEGCLLRKKPERIIHQNQLGQVDASFHQSPALARSRPCSMAAPPGEQTIHQHLKYHGASSEIEALADVLIANEYGADRRSLSLTGLHKECRDLGDHTFLLKRSLASALEPLTAAVREHIILNTPVTAIDYSGRRIKITDVRGGIHTCGKLILSVPLSSYQRKLIRFTPAMPRAKQHAIQNIGMGSAIKIVVEFTRNLWGSSVDVIIGQWLIHNFSPAARGHLLSTLVTGRRANTIGRYSKKRIMEAYHRDLSAILNVPTSQFVHQYWIRNWNKVPYILGGYSYPLKGDTLRSRQILAEPLGRKVFFCGEALDVSGGAGMLSGAINSSIAVLKELGVEWREKDRKKAARSARSRDAPP